MRFADVCHQERAISIIRRALSSGRTHHAYLFDGPEGVGKRTSAMALVGRLLCESSGLAADADACGDCPSCRLVASNNHPDFHPIHRGLHTLHPDPSVRRSKGLFLAVDVVRHFLIACAGLKPSRGRARVFLIREAERMNDGAQNALLKTLEEPPGASRLILLTTAASRLLPTIRSRCQIVSFGPLPPGFVEQRLQAETKMTAETAHMFSRLCDGRLGAALRWHRLDLESTLSEVASCLGRLENRDITEFGKGLIETAESLARRMIESQKTEEPQRDELSLGAANNRKRPTRAKAPKTAASKAVPTDDFRAAMKLVLMLIAAVYRDALIMESKGSSALTTLPERYALANGVDPESCIRAVAEAETMLDRNVNNQLLCEHLAARLSGSIVSAAP